MSNTAKSTFTGSGTFSNPAENDRAHVLVKKQGSTVVQEIATAQPGESVSASFSLEKDQSLDIVNAR